MDRKKFVSLCQLAIAARKTARGDALLPSIQKGQAKLVLYSSVCGANRRKKITDKCATYQIPALEVPADLFEQIHSGVASALAVCDQGFTDKLQELMNE
ncbi:MAG: hypothetical protein HUJ54_06880 [Erysipelotrichaceae bacterium]|nr:hypothetical protein [Erysipelotrichaceae bacterium]